VIHDLRLGHRKNANFVMPAWIAGIQTRKNAFGNIHVNLEFQRSMLE